MGAAVGNRLGADRRRIQQRMIEQPARQCVKLAGVKLERPDLRNRPTHCDGDCVHCHVRSHVSTPPPHRGAPQRDRDLSIRLAGQIYTLRVYESSDILHFACGRGAVICEYHRPRLLCFMLAMRPWP